VLTRIAVVVPAHDEEALLPACLASIAMAATRVGVPVEVIVVADDCRDGTERLALAAGARVVTIGSRLVGSARAAGAEAALASSPQPESIWLACTDADTEVPPDWLLVQMAHACRGADVVVGTVTVADWREWPPGTGSLFDRAYREQVLARSHGHVHGANLGIRGSAYRRVGGFSAVAVGEDRLLVGAARRAGLRVVTTGEAPVRTSARRRARAPDGFSAALAALDSAGSGDEHDLAVGMAPLQLAVGVPDLR
jgi:glycosyltransferase involved in cell wall biosynthesis